MNRIATATLCLLALALPAAASDLSGQYRVKGTNLDGSAYEGSAEILVTSDSTCVISWQIAGRESTGICMPDGDALAAAYVMGDAVGLVVYRVRDGGVLDGLWTIAGQRGQGTDLLTPAD